MEDKEKIVKVYSNNSKKSRLKRNKNKFQRIWDAEKQTYVKVRKSKYPAKSSAKSVDWKSIDDSDALKRRHETPKKPKEVAKVVNKPEVKQPARKTIKPVEKKAVTIRIHGINHSWDTKSMRYKRAA